MLKHKWWLGAVLAVVVVGAVWALAARDDPNASAPAGWDPVLGPLALQVSTNRDLEWKRPVRLRLIDPEARDPSADDPAMPAALPTGTAAKGFHLSAGLGLLSRATSMAPKWWLYPQRRSSQILGMASADELTLYDNGKVSPADRLLVIHELTHAILGQNGIEPAEATTLSDSDKYLRVLVNEGDAILAEHDYMRGLSTRLRNALRSDWVSPGSLVAKDDIRARVLTELLPSSISLPAIAESKGPARALAAVRASGGTKARNAMLLHPPRSQAALFSPARLGEKAVDQAEFGPIDGASDRFGFLAVTKLVAALGALNDPEVGLYLADSFAGGAAYVDERNSDCDVIVVKLVGESARRSATALVELAELRGGGLISQRGPTRAFRVCGQGRTVTTEQLKAALTPLLYRLAAFAALIERGAPRQAAERIATKLALDPALANDHWEVFIGWPIDPSVITRAMIQLGRARG